MTTMAVSPWEVEEGRRTGAPVTPWGEEFDLARSLIDANETVRLTQPQRATRQRTPRRVSREFARKRASSD